MKAKLTNQELFYFCEQFSILLHSGISCAEGIQLMLEDSHTQKGRDFFQSLQTDYEENGSFYISLHNTGLFPDSMISYVKIGEETGCLDEVLNSLSLHYQQEMEISENIKSAIILSFENNLEKSFTVNKFTVLSAIVISSSSVFSVPTDSSNDVFIF